MKHQFDYASLPYGGGGQHRDHNRFNWRCELLLTRNRPMIEGKRVLDLACNTGRLSYPCLALGAASVTGVEARQDLIDAGRGHLEGTGFEDRMNWVQSDLFEFLESAQPGQFDTILCFGFLYHTVRQVDFYREVKRLSPENVIIDTGVVKNYLWYGRRHFLKRPAAMFVAIDDPSETSDTTDDDGVVFFPSTSFLEQMFDVIGYEWERIDYSRREIGDWSGLDDYRKGTRASYRARRKAAAAGSGGQERMNAAA